MTYEYKLNKLAKSQENQHRITLKSMEKEMLEITLRDKEINV